MTTHTRSPALAARLSSWKPGTAILLAGLILGVLPHPGLAADAAPAAPAAAPEARFTFAQPAQPLLAALTEFTAVTGVQVVRRSDQGLTQPANALNGSFTAREALVRLLAGSGLTARFAGPATVTLEPAASGDGAVQLGPVTVAGSARAVAESAWGPVDGTVARRTAAGTKTDTPLLEVPQSVSVVTREQMTARAVQEDSDALLYTPGVYAQPYGAALSQFNPFMVIRGFSAANGASYLDGLPLETNIRTEPYGLERSEVLRGPSSVLFGASDPGGLVHRVSKRAPDTLQREMMLQAGSYERKQGAFDIGGPVDEEGTVRARLTGLVREGDAAVDYDYDQRGANDRKFLAPTVTLTPREGSSATLYASLMQDNATQESSARYPDYTLTHVRVNQDGADQFEYTHALAGYAVEQALGDDWTLRQNLRASSLDYAYTSMSQNSMLADRRTVTRSVFGFDSQTHALFTDTMVEKKWTIGGSKHVILAGVDARSAEDRTAFSWGMAPNLDIRNPDYGQRVRRPQVYMDTTTDTTAVGTYVQDQITLAERWVLTVGARKDWAWTEATDELYGGVTDQTDDAMTYRAGLSYQTGFGLAPYVSYAESFLPVGGSDAAGNPFSPTTGRQYEAGIKYQPPALPVSLAAAVFDLRKQNVPTPDPDNTGFSVQTGEVSSQGVELEAVAELLDGLRFNASYTYTDAEISRANDGNQGNRPVLAPKHMASAWLEYTLPGAGWLHGLTVGGGARHVGKTYATADNTIRNKASTLFDASIRYDLGAAAPELAGAKLAVNATNVLNHDYQSCYSRFDCAWGTPQVILGTLTYTW